jgi:hypothetical protein
MRHVVQEWCTTAVERLKIHGFIVWRASLPTPREDAHPCAGPGAHGGLVRLALGALLLGGDLRPQGMPGGCRCPRDNRVSQARRPLEAPVDPRFLAAAVRHGRHPRLLLACLGRSVAFSLCATGHAEAWGTDGPGAWHGVKDNGKSGWSWAPGAMAVATSAMGSTHVVRPAAALQRGAPRAVRRFARRPVTEAVAKDRGIFVLKPLQAVGQGVFAGPGQAVGEPHGVADQAPAMCDEWREGTQRRAVGGERRERVAVGEQPLALERGIGGGIGGMARGNRCAVLRQGERMDGTEHEAIIGAQRRYAGPFREVQAHRAGVSGEARAPGLDPRINRRGAVCESEQLAALSASSLEAHIGCGIRPVEANKGRQWCECWWLQVGAPRVGYSGTKGHAGGRAAPA